MTTAPNGHLLVTNGLNGQVVEIDPDSRHADLCALDRRQQGAVPARQRRSVRHRHDAGGRRVLLRGGRGEHARPGTLSGRRVFPGLRPAGWSPPPARARTRPDASRADPFSANIRRGIATPQQTQTYFAALDLIAKKPGDVVRMLRAWTDAAATPDPRPGNDPADSGEAAGLGAAGLTLTFGFGAGLFRRSLRTRRAPAGGAGRPARVQRRPTGGGAQRRRPVDPGLRRRSAGGVPRRAATGAPGGRRGARPLDADRLPARRPRRTRRRAT